MELNADIFAANYNEVIEIHKEFHPFPDVLPALAKLKQKGYELAVMSNSTNQLMDKHMEKLEHLLDNSLVAEETMCYKPRLAFFCWQKKNFSSKAKTIAISQRDIGGTSFLPEKWGGRKFG